MKNTSLKIVACCVTVLLIIVFIVKTYEKDNINIENYYVEKDVHTSVRIIHLTDLHNHEFGKDNIRLINKIEALNPDLIFITGDMINQDEDNTDIICNLVSKLTDIAPVYYGYGNDEFYWRENGGELESLLSDSGAVVLNCEYEDVEVNGEELRIGGYYGYYRVPHMKTNDALEQQRESEFFNAFEDTDNLKLLLCHIPTAWLDWRYIDKYPVDIVFSGHYHGGQIRIPFVGGLYAPYVGFFPEYTKGMFEGETSTCVLSPGLGSDSIIPRINNRPEITVVDIMPAAD